ncbi:sterol desaturase [Pacificimonas flava]|uniref:Sterol desaturase n=2 Tax=Pacificimonas TaxID=1960290 RepID=A0A219B1S6_9SPHN|nr:MULTISPECIES: sterol desaturase family protein [Pacificimonas]MBZ6379767.1 sterol desaturase family protein [Pacificimonas aurantium]OWV31778.1 sterol desaturase [Pacificimonas flava]
MQLSLFLAAAVFLTLVIGLRYLAVAGVFAWLTARRRPGLHGSERSRRQQRRERRWSLLSALIYAVPAAAALAAYRSGGTAIYADANAYPLWWLPLSVLVYLFLHDTWFYWTHRAMHARRLFPVMHKVHHDSRPPTAWAAMSFHWTESLSGAFLIPALSFVIPIHLGALAVVLAVMTLFGTTNHLGWEIFPRRLVHGSFGKIVITASHHHRHHKDYGSNFGLYFRFWDRLMRTDTGVSGDFGREEREARSRADRRRLGGGDVGDGTGSGAGSEPGPAPAE